MNSEFKAILENIETSLKAALPQSSAKDGWIPASFGPLPAGATPEYIDKLSEPNYTLISLGGKRWRPLLLMLCYKMAARKSGSPALTEEEAYSITDYETFISLYVQFELLEAPEHKDRLARRAEEKKAAEAKKAAKERRDKGKKPAT